MSRVDSVLEQPHAGIHGGLSGADDDEPFGPPGDVRELVDGDPGCTIADIEGRRGGGGNGGRKVRGVDEPFTDLDVEGVTGKARNEAVVANVVALRKEADLPRGDQAPGHDSIIVRADLGPARAFIHAGLGSTRLDGVASKRHRIDAVEGRGLMQADEGVGIIPVAAGRGSPIHHDDLGVRLGDERVRERHSGRSAADDEIV
jgi:hypothetical protein